MIGIWVTAIGIVASVILDYGLIDKRRITMSAYVVVDIGVFNPEVIRIYQAGASCGRSLRRKYPRWKDWIKLAGDWVPKRLVILEFESC
jgi:hypothetical protein